MKPEALQKNTFIIQIVDYRTVGYVPKRNGRGIRKHSTLYSFPLSHVNH